MAATALILAGGNARLFLSQNVKRHKRICCNSSSKFGATFLASGGVLRGLWFVWGIVSYLEVSQKRRLPGSQPQDKIQREVRFERGLHQLLELRKDAGYR